MIESARYILQILVFVAIILSIGTSGYLIIEDGISASDAFYTTVTAITPTHFEERHQLSVPGRYFTVGLVFCGFGAMVAFATQFARLIIQSELEGVGVITRKQMRRRISRMKDHYIVCGYGEIGGAICGELRDQNLPFVVITDNESSVAAIQREGFALVRGNPTADACLKEAEIERARGVIAVLAGDSNNLFISLAARELNPKVFIIARGEDAGVEDRILRAGADIVVSPMKLGGRQIAELIKQQASAASIVTGAAGQSSVLGMSLTLYNHAAADPMTVAEVLDNQPTAVGVAGIQHADGLFESTPPPDVNVNRGDSVVLITRVVEHGEPVSKHPTGKTILLADDHRALRLLFTRKLAAAGHDVVQAATGDEALAMARASSPDLIVLDVEMPKKDGYEVCNLLRRSTQFANVPIILYSGHATAEFTQRGRAAGADMCVRKTSKSSDLLASIEQVFSQRITNRNEEPPAAGKQPTATDGDREEVASDDDVLDLDLAMENAGGDWKLFGELVTAMIESTPEMMNQIELAVTQQDHESIRRAAHSLKSALAVIGACAASHAAARLESAGADCDTTNIDQLHADLQQQISAMNLALEPYVPSASSKEAAS